MPIEYDGHKNLFARKWVFLARRKASCWPTSWSVRLNYSQKHFFFCPSLQIIPSTCSTGRLNWPTAWIVKNVLHLSTRAEKCKTKMGKSLTLWSTWFKQSKFCFNPITKESFDISKGWMKTEFRLIKLGKGKSAKVCKEKGHGRTNEDKVHLLDPQLSRVTLQPISSRKLSLSDISWGSNCRPGFLWACFLVTFLNRKKGKMRRQ